MSLRASVVAAVMILAPASALAADHVMKVGEVLLSNNGSTTSQYIELEDMVNEPFPSTYSIEFFNASGAIIGTQALTIPTGTMRFLIATAQAKTDFAVTANATLTVALPTNGQACFKNLSGRIHCLAWGVIATQIVGVYGSDTGGSPPNGMSLQRTNGYSIATPTPGTANIGSGVDGPLPDAGVLDSPLAGDAPAPDAPMGVNPLPVEDDGCSIGANASWFGLLLFATVLIVVRRRSTRGR